MGMANEGRVGGTKRRVTQLPQHYERCVGGASEGSGRSQWLRVIKMCGGGLGGDRGCV